MDYKINIENKNTTVRSGISNEVLFEGGAQAAFEYAISSIAENNGGTIQVGSGKYVLDNTLTLGSNTQLEGRGASTVLALAPTSNDETILQFVEANQSALAQLSLQGNHQTPNGAILDHSGHCAIDGVHAQGFERYGLLVENNSFMCRIANSFTSDNAIAGIGFSKNLCGRGGDWVPNLLQGCQSTGERGHGFHIHHSICTNIVGCQSYQSEKDGFHIDAHSNSTCVTGCRTYQAIGNGITVKDSHEINISSNIFCWNRGHGIQMEFVFWGTLSANNCIDNGARTEPLNCGIHLSKDCRTIQVSANAIFNWPGHLPMEYGIYESEDCMNNQISSNNIHYCKSGLVFSAGSGSVAPDNIGCKEAYPHPSGTPPLAPYTEQPLRINGELQNDFTLDRVRAFIADNKK